MGGELPIFPHNHHLCSERMGVILKEHTVLLFEYKEKNILQQQ